MFLFSKGDWHQIVVIFFSFIFYEMDVEGAEMITVLNESLSQICYDVFYVIFIVWRAYEFWNVLCKGVPSLYSVRQLKGFRLNANGAVEQPSLVLFVGRLL